MSKTSTEALLTAYRSLPLPERQTLQLLAFFAAPIARSPLVAMLTQLRIRFTPTRAINARDLVVFFGSARQMGLVVEQRENFRCQREIQFQLIRQCQLEGLFGEYCSLVAKQMENDYYRSQEHALQLLRLGFFMHKPDKVTTALTVLRRYYSHDVSIMASIFPEPLDTDWVTDLPPLLISSLINALLIQTVIKLKPTSAFAILDHLKATARLSSDLSYSYPVYLLLQGRFSEVEQAITEPGMNQYQGHRGMLALIQGQIDQAINCFDQELLIVKKQTGKRKIVLPGILGLMHCLALLAGGLPQQFKQTIELASIGLKHDEYTEKSAYTYILLTAEARSGNTRSSKTLKDFCGQTNELLPVSQLIRALCGWWQQLPLPQEQLNSLRQFAIKARDVGMLWLAAQLLLVARTIDPVGTNNTEWAENLSKELQMVNLASLARDDQKSWERSLNALLQLGKTDKNTVSGAKDNDSRLIWLIDGNIRTNFAHIQPLEQKLSSKGWSRGRNVALKRMAEEPGKLPFLTHQDLAVTSCIRKERSYGYYSQTSYDFNTAKALKALIGHPLLFNHLNEPMTIAKGEFAISVKKKGKQLSLSISPALNADSQPFSLWESENRLLVYEPTAEQLRIAGIIGNDLSIPQEAEKQVAAAVTAVSPHLMIQSDLITVSDEAISVEADSRLHILLRPSGEGIQAELRVQPFGEQGPQFRPGQGGSTVIAEVDGKKLHCLRNLLEEKQHHKLLMQTCSTFDLYDSEHETWRIENPDGTLELLEELQALMQTEPDCLVLHWPEGERFKLKGQATWDRFKVNVSSGREWLSLEGELRVSEDEVLTLKQLLELATVQHGRFIQLDSGEFIALTDEFRRRLDELQRITERHGKGEQRVHQLSAPLLDEALSGAGGIKGDKGWKQLLERFKAAQDLQPAIPPTLQAELRDYQQEGFTWLCRLAHWGVGACLADDMGLGKTVQALALLLTRAPDGPSLVLAPTSVCFNWENEARRFAPTLEPRIFGSGNRQQFIESLKPFDLVICSYTLFQQESELLTGVNWHTVVLDEAQAIKNMTTKRSQAAMQLQAGFRIATTGTPVENRLDELWNLFRFLNPGLLGSHQGFTERFGTPIEKNQDKAARNLLRKLIRPFILRRTKSQVLEELPPRTDILHRIELSDKEMAFYEALRRSAIEKLTETEGQGPGERQIRILAEIMRLRRACCNPQLVMKDSSLPSAKLAAFHEIVAELRSNGHRALVFSQFVDHLTIVRKSLEAEGITYCYLDGSTPQKDRQSQVATFQSGKGELFLISLKAGGTGLNLTAADYVIHLDPWWNPAVEDQASDRAHRIGQLRPVTVYRLVAANTIEEKIVAMHHQKRELADSLLEGTESAGRVSADDLLELLRDAG